MAHLKIRGKIYSIVAVLGVAASIIAGIGMYAIDEYGDRVDSLEQSQRLAFLAEQSNHYITAINAGTRGISSSLTPDETRGYIAEVDKASEKLLQSLAEWQSITPAEDLAAFTPILDQAKAYVRGRKEIATAGLENGAAAAKAITNADPAIRQSRVALQGSIDQWTASIHAKLDPARAEMAQQEQHMLRLLAVSTLVALLIGGAISTWIATKMLSRPLVRVVGSVNQMAAGNLAIDIEQHRARDEIGELTTSTARLLIALREAEKLKREQAEAEARAGDEKAAFMRGMADDFEAAVGEIVRTVSAAATELEAAAESMSGAATETSAQSSVVAAASEEASANVQTVASAAEELTASVAEISRQVTDSAQMALRAVDSANATSAKVDDLSQAANEIGEIVSLITQIAEQTNLLALNATIEAARAGEAGRGFAVVAAEVKNLAQKTAHATDQISSKIRGIQTSTSESAEAITGIIGVIQNLSDISGAIAAAVTQQGAATQEIARNVQQAYIGTNEVSSNIVGVTRAAEDSAAASTQVLGSAGELSRQSELLHSEVAKVLSTLRAA